MTSVTGTNTSRPDVRGPLVEGGVNGRSRGIPSGRRPGDPHPLVGLGERRSRRARRAPRSPWTRGPSVAAGCRSRHRSGDEQFHGRHRIGARLGPADHAHHDLAAAGLGSGIGAVGQLPVDLARDPGRGKGQDRLLVDAQRDGRRGTPERGRTAIQVVTRRPSTPTGEEVSMRECRSSSSTSKPPATGRPEPPPRLVGAPARPR